MNGGTALVTVTVVEVGRRADHLGETIEIGITTVRPGTAGTTPVTTGGNRPATVITTIGETIPHHPTTISLVTIGTGRVMITGGHQAPGTAAHRGVTGTKGTSAPQDTQSEARLMVQTALIDHQVQVIVPRIQRTPVRDMAATGFQREVPTSELHVARRGHRIHQKTTAQ